MKNIIKILVLSMCFNLNAQISTPTKTEVGIVIGKARRLSNVPVLKMYQYNGDTKEYSLFFNNLEYAYITDIKSISFYGTDKELDVFYRFLLSGLKVKGKQSIMIGEQTVTVQRTGSSVLIFVHYPYEPSGWFYLSKKQINRLFGKL